MGINIAECPCCKNKTLQLVKIFYLEKCGRPIKYTCSNFFKCVYDVTLDDVTNKLCFIIKKYLQKLFADNIKPNFKTLKRLENNKHSEKAVESKNNTLKNNR